MSPIGSLDISGYMHPYACVLHKNPKTRLSSLLQADIQNVLMLSSEFIYIQRCYCLEDITQHY